MVSLKKKKKKEVMWGDDYVNQTYCADHFTVRICVYILCMYQVIMLYTLNLYNILCQLYLNKLEGVGNSYCFFWLFLLDFQREECLYCLFIEFGATWLL